jgi:hypothetical protein
VLLNGQSPAVTFKVEINYVEIDARVLDAQGRFVRDLTKDDFEIVEDGRPQSLSTSSFVDIPVESPAGPPRSAAEPDVVTNAHDFDGRLYLFVHRNCNSISWGQMSSSSITTCPAGWRLSRKGSSGGSRNTTGKTVLIREHKKPDGSSEMSITVGELGA